MATAIEKIWGKGARRELAPGHHYKVKAGSLKVPEGEVVRLYQKQDKTGRKSRPLYEGTYQDTSFHVSGTNYRPGVIVVEKTDVRKVDTVKIGWRVKWKSGRRSGHFPMQLRIPIGDRRMGDDFPNDEIEWIEIPFGLSVELYNNDRWMGGNLFFGGNKEGETVRIDLKDYGYSDRVSSMRVKADDWEMVGLELRDPKIVGQSKKVAATSKLFNNSEHTATVSKEIAYTVTKTVGEEWNVGSRVCASIGFETNTAVKVTGNLEVEISGSYGGNKSTETSRTYEDEVSVEIEGRGAASISSIVEYGKLEAEAIRKWRNKRTGKIIEETGKITVEDGSRAQHEVH